MRRSTPLAALAAALALSFVGAGPAGAAPSFGAGCPDPPGAPAPDEITDAAIEVRNLRIENAAACAALLERADYLAERSERDTDVLADVRTIVAVGVGVQLAALFGVAFWRTFGAGEAR